MWTTNYKQYITFKIVSLTEDIQLKGDLKYNHVYEILICTLNFFENG